MKNKYASVSGRLAAATALVAVILSPVVASAISTTANTTVNATVSSVISMTTSTTVAIGITPTASGAMSSSSDAVSVSTNNSLGYTLTLADTDATTTLVSGANTIAADSGTQAVPSASLTLNRWGYRVDSIGGFGAGATTAETNIASSAFKWAGVPATGAPNTIKSASTTATNDITTVWYGVKVDTSKPNGVYTDSVTYTATTN